MIFLIAILAIFFAMNMGGASFAASFAASYGGKVISKRRAAFFFILFVVLGSVLLGEKVSMTLGEDIVAPDLMTQKAIVIVFFSAGLSMFIANIMKIPQSTSLVTVASIAGVGAFYKSVNLTTLLYLIPFWILLPVLSYGVTLYMAGHIYPPRRGNFWIYERVVNKRDRLVMFVILANCYNAFSVGTNNVANVVGPLVSLSSMSITTLLFAFAVFYGLGALLFSAPMKTASHDIVPLGLLSASFISLVSGTLMIIASSLGVPQSFVMLKIGAIFAVSTLKHGSDSTFSNPLTRKTLYTWTINPLITFAVSYGLAWIIL